MQRQRYERSNTNKIDCSECIRCGKIEEEDWEHVWTCEDNEFSIDDVIRESPYKFEKLLEIKNKSNEIAILRNHLCNFLTILESPSIILRGKSRKWELIRGIFNDNFNNLTKIKEEITVIKELWNFIYDEIKERIWIPRCKEVARLEEKENIKKVDLRSKKQDLFDNQIGTLEIENFKNKKTRENLEKAKKNNINNQIKIVTLDKLTGAITDGMNIEKSWDTIIKYI
ncbi:unnamed protein product [Rhizophagus irregularis]|nr:unnamed protein product [Rhizophagus irregularis]